MDLLGNAFSVLRFCGNLNDGFSSSKPIESRSWDVWEFNDTAGEMFGEDSLDCDDADILLHRSFIARKTIFVLVISCFSEGYDKRNDKSLTFLQGYLRNIISTQSVNQSIK